MKIPRKWTFNDHEVAKHFDKHVREQLPWYDMVTDAITQIGNHYIPEGGEVYDIGASTGNIERALYDTLFSRKAGFYPIEKSKEMAEAYAGTFTPMIADATEISYDNADFVVCFLTMMFMPPKSRIEFVQNVMSGLNVGGAFVVVEKTMPPNGYPSTVLSRLTLKAKLDQGVLPEDIIDKELSLAGAQRPVDVVNLFYGMGCNTTEFFRYGDFAGYIVEK